jgi:hypothetical protein
MAVIRPEPPQSGQGFSPTRPDPLQVGQVFSPVCLVPGVSSSPGFFRSVSDMGASLQGKRDVATEVSAAARCKDEHWLSCDREVEDKTLPYCSLDS